MKRIASIALLSLLVACKGHKGTVSNTETTVNQEAERPEWVRSRPMDSYSYIGVGLCPKSRGDFQETAKKNALNDLASEISVTVEGNSLLYTLDRKYQFDEQFTSTINTRTSEQLEGYELVDSWENGTEYWIYYRLSKAEHARIKAERKAKAIAQATDFFGRARTSIAAGDLKNAFDQDVRALMAMKEYWGENDLVMVGEKQVPLANEIFSDLQALTSGVRISILPERCELNYGNRFKRELLIGVEFQSGSTQRDLVQLPLIIEYPGVSGKVTERKNSDTEGRVHTTVQHVLAEGPAEVVVRLDLEALVSKDLDPTFVKPLTGSLTVPEKRAPIDLVMPKVNMQSLEKNMGQPVTDAGVALALREELSKRGFRFVDKAVDADLLMVLNTTTREGGTASGFFTAYLDVAYSFKDRRTSEVIYDGGRQGVKGVQLDYQKAGMDAYKKAVQEVKKEAVPAILGALL